MSVKSVVAVIIVAILIGVLYVVFEKNFTASKTLSNSKPSSAQEVAKNTEAAAQEESSAIKYPSADPTPAPLTGSSDLMQEAEGLQMRDYSTYFEDLKDTVSSQ